MRERLIELLRDTFNYTKGVCIDFDEAVEINADYLIENGVVALPCKVGDVVYTNIIGTGMHNSFMINNVDILGFGNGIYFWTWHQLGKSVFLTLDDAEAALKGGAK